MCYDLAEFDPFEPLFIMTDIYFGVELDSEPMTDEDWEEWLAND
jgi:hypothetical protein